MLYNKNIIETEFYYEDYTPICIGDVVLFHGINKEGMVSYIKGSICISFFDHTIPDILFYNMYIHDNNSIKAFHKIHISTLVYPNLTK